MTSLGLATPPACCRRQLGGGDVDSCGFGIKETAANHIYVANSVQHAKTDRGQQQAGVNARHATVLTALATRGPLPVKFKGGLV